MAHGVPVVATDFPLLREVIDDCGCGVLLTDGTPATIARAIESLLHDPAAARAMGLRGREAVSTRYNWSTEIAQVSALYDEL